MRPVRGGIYLIEEPAPETLLVVSGNLYNELPDHPWVLAMKILPELHGTGRAPFFLPAGDAGWVETDTVRRRPKRLLKPSPHSPLAVQALADIDNALFRILATN